MKKFVYTLALLSLLTVSLPANSSGQKFVRWGGEVSCFNYGDWQTGIIPPGEHSSKELKFNPADWQQNLLGRKQMLNDLTSDHSLVGLRKDEVRKLLGNPQTFPNKYPFDDRSKKDTDWYRISYSSCGNSPRNYFVLNYSKSKVTGYREVEEALLGPKYFKRLQAQDPHWHQN